MIRATLHGLVFEAETQDSPMTVTLDGDVTLDKDQAADVVAFLLVSVIRDPKLVDEKIEALLQAIQQQGG